MYILILILFYDNGMSGMTQQGYEFKTLEQCEKAKSFYTGFGFSEGHSFRGTLQVSADCHKK